MDVIPFEDGLVKRKDVYSDSVSILRQVGLLDSDSSDPDRTSSWSIVHSRGSLSSRQRLSFAPWRMRWPLTWSNVTSATSSGRTDAPLELASRVPAARVAAAALAGLVGSEERRQLAFLLRLEAGGVADDLQLAAVVI